MTTINNPLLTPLNELLNHLNVLQGLLDTLNNQLKNFRNLLTQRLERDNIDMSHIAIGTRLAITDLIGPMDQGYFYFAPSGKSFTAQGEEYLDTARALIAREAAWTVSQSYEAFETFLKSITATYLQVNKNQAEPDRIAKLDKKLRTLSNVDIEYWKQYVNSYRGKNSVELFEYLRRLAPTLAIAEQNNNRQLDLILWYQRVSEVRHAATHSDMIIRKDRLQNWSPSIAMRDWAPAAAEPRILYPGVYTEQGYKLILSPHDAKVSLELFGEYAFMIFKCLSVTQQYEWNIFGMKSK